MRNCDCPSCPCAVPIIGSRKRDCPECRRGNHMDWHTTERRLPAPISEEGTLG